MWFNAFSWYEEINKLPYKVTCFSQGKNLSRNEDSFFFDEKKGIFIVCDGATDKSWKIYQDKTGWELASRIAVEGAKKSDAIGKTLIWKINAKINEYYRQHMIDIQNPFSRFSSTCVVARIQKRKIIITQVWDTSFRVNGKDIYHNNKLIDTITLTIRQQILLFYWEEYISEARKCIEPILKYQYHFQNTQEIILFNEKVLEYFFSLMNEEYMWYEQKQYIFKNTQKILSSYYWQDLSYWFLDGTFTPLKFIKVFEFEENEISTLEIFSDGYFWIPDEASLEAWEAKQSQIEQEDPLKYKKYPSTKTTDDRTIMIIKFANI